MSIWGYAMAKPQVSSKVDLSEFVRLAGPKRKRPCPVGTTLPHLTDREKGQLLAAAADDTGVITNAAIRDWLKARGYESNVAGIISHRKKTCACNE